MMKLTTKEGFMNRQEFLAEWEKGGRDFSGEDLRAASRIRFSPKRKSDLMGLYNTRGLWVCPICGSTKKTYKKKVDLVDGKIKRVFVSYCYACECEMEQRAGKPTVQ